MKSLKKLALICIAVVGFALVTQAAVNLVIPKPKIVSATTNDKGTVLLVVEFTNTEYLDLFEIIDGVPTNHQGTFSVDYSGEERICTITITGFTPGLHTFIVLASSSEDFIGTWSAPFTVYVNAVEP